MFRRRNPLPLLNRVRDLVWPSRGWRRASLYIAHRVRRLPGTPYRIAAGFACGAAISFTPFIGFHFIGAAMLSLLIRANVVASAAGTVVGNPWTFPVIWAWIYALGQWLLGGEAVSDLPVALSFTYIFDRPMDVLWPMTVGGIPTAIVAWVGFYLPIRGAVAEYQNTRLRRTRKRMQTDRFRREGRRTVAAAAEEEPKES